METFHSEQVAFLLNTGGNTRPVPWQSRSPLNKQEIGLCDVSVLSSLGLLLCDINTRTDQNGLDRDFHITNSKENREATSKYLL